jgi:Zn-dependent peptidase ImmA (M78 family)
MATDLAPITPSVLKWARESIGASLGDAAKRANVSVARVEAWEAGEAEPTLAKLRELAKLYQRPLAIFFLPEPPLDYESLRDFRRLPGHTDHTWSRPLHKVYRKAVEQQATMSELLEADGERASVRVPSVSLTANPEDAAEVGRRALRIRLADQFKWRKPEEAFVGWLEAVERLGVLVMRTSDVALEEMRGMALTGDDVPPVIVVNALDYPRGQVFSLIHECVHLMLREGGLCDLLEPDAKAAQRIEKFCNATAAALLLPRQAFLEEEVVKPPGVREWDDDDLAYLSHRYGVSQEAVLRRLVTLKRASMDYYLTKREEWLEAYERDREQAKAKRRQSASGPPPYRMVVRDRGRPYVRTVLDAYQREVITPSTLSNLLGLKLKHLGALEHELRLRQ